MPSPITVLADFLTARFTIDELRNAIRRVPGGERLLQQVPENASRETYAFQVADALERRGMLDERLFAVLIEERPRYETDIHKLAQLWDSPKEPVARGEGRSPRPPVVPFAESTEASAYEDPAGAKPPPTPPRLVARGKLVAAAVDRLRDHRLLWIHGGYGSGKTQLALAVANRLGCRSWLELRDVPPPEATVRLRGCLASAARAGQQIDACAVIVVDDLSPRSETVLNALHRLAMALAPVVVTSGAAPPTRFAHDVGLNGPQVFQVPPLNIHEIVELLALHGATEETAPALASLVLALSKGHPELAVATIRCLAARGWPGPVEALDHLGSDAGLRQLRDDALLRLHRTTPDAATRQLLYRACTAGAPLSEATLAELAAVPPGLDEARGRVAELEGLWLQRVANGDVSVSPTIASIGAAELAQAVRQSCHGAVARTILAKRVLTPFEGLRTVHHFTSAGDVQAAAGVYVAGLTQLHRERAYDRDVGLIDLWADDLPDGLDPERVLALRGLQLLVGAHAGRPVRPRLARLLQALKPLEPLADPELVTMTFAAMVGAAWVALDREPAAATSIMESAFLPIRVPRPLQAHHLQLSAVLIRQLMGAAAGGALTAEQFCHVVRGLPERVTAGVAGDEGMVLASVHMTEQMWLRASAETRPTEEVIAELTAVEHVAVTADWGFLRASARRARISMAWERARDLDEARGLAEEASEWPSSDVDARFLVHEALGRQLRHAGFPAEALSHLRAALSTTWDGVADTRAYACLEAACAAFEVGNNAEAIAWAEAAGAPESSALVRLRACAIVALLKRRAGQSALLAWESFGQGIVAERSLDSDSWKELMVLAGHALGYEAAAIAGDSPPAHTITGEPYLVPTPTMFLVHDTSRARLYKPALDWAVAHLVARVAEAERAWDAQLRWEQIAYDSAIRLGDPTGITMPALALMPEACLGFNWEEAMRLGALAMTGLFSADPDAGTPGGLPAPSEDDVSEHTLAYVLFSAVVALTRDGGTLSHVKEAADLANVLANQPRDSRQASFSLAVAQCIATRAPPSHYHQLVTEFRDEVLLVSRLAALLAAGLHSDAAPRQAAVDCLSVLFNLDRVVKPQALVRSALASSLHVHWRERVHRQAFYFGSPSEVSAAMESVDSRAVDGARKLMQVVIDSLGVRAVLPEGPRAWLSER